MTRDELRRLVEANQALRDELAVVREDLQQVEARIATIAPLAAKLTGYVDVGFFRVAGNGSGIRSDTGHRVFPEYAAVPDSWVFLGDPLSTAVNARGEPASTGDSRAVAFDAIRAGGSSFLPNSLSVGLFAEVAKQAVFTGAFDLVPRGRDVSRGDELFVGDFVDVRLANLEYRIARPWIELGLSAGKLDSVVGFEYRSQAAPSRIEVTPSLICRYTCGYPLGIKARAGVLDGALSLNVAVTNGAPGTEGFPFHDEVDSNDGKTLAGRLAYRLPIAGELELGVSGAIGAQDRQAAGDVWQYLYGADIHVHRHDLVVRGELVQGKARGASEAGGPRCGLAPCLRFKGGYALAGYRVTNLVMPYVRLDWRDALHESGLSFVYISHLYRVTPGVRLALTENVTVKAEYTVNRELGRIPQFANDVFTTALVVKY